MRAILLVAALLAVPSHGRAEVVSPSAPDDLTSIGLESLMQLEVTSVSRREEPLFRAASAITVITADDIARSGATNIPDLLRSVPGMNVAQINANTWAVSARGFNGQYANKMLVLVDGRSVYSALFSGVYWDALDLLLEDVQRIEVIRGPGATAWGANAVNGVLNIITKAAATGQGLSSSVTAGDFSNRGGGISLAGPAGRAADFRGFAKFKSVGRMSGLDQRDGFDAMNMAHAGGRLDWHRSAKDEATFHGDLYTATVEQRYTEPLLDAPYSRVIDSDGNARGGHLMASWQRRINEKSALRLKTYFDANSRSGRLASEKTTTFDFDFQHQLALGTRHDLMWGGGYRAVQTTVMGSPKLWLDPARRTMQGENLFVQDAITVVPSRITLTLGSKFEHNDFSGFEVEPSARLLWAASPVQTVWAAVSRAARTPGPTDHDLNVMVATYPLGGGAVGESRLIGSEIRPEIMTAVELGYRAQAGPHLTFDLASFVSRYLHLRSFDIGEPFADPDPAPGHMVFPLYFGNSSHGTIRGLEGAMEWRPNSRFTLGVSHSMYWTQIAPNAGATTLIGDAHGDAPTYQLFVHPHLILSDNFTLDATWSHVDDLPSQQAPAYDRVDALLGWKATPHLELSAGVRNLFHDRDLEWSNSTGLSASTTVRTGAYGKVSWRP